MTIFVQFKYLSVAMYIPTFVILIVASQGHNDSSVGVCYKEWTENNSWNETKTCYRLYMSPISLFSQLNTNFEKTEYCS